MKQTKPQEIFSIHLTKDNYKNVFVLEQGKLFTKQDDDKIIIKNFANKKHRIENANLYDTTTTKKPFMNIQYIYLYIRLYLGTQRDSGYSKLLPPFTRTWSILPGN